MPPVQVKTVREIIFYQYSKIISEAAGYGKGNYGMIMRTWEKLCSGEMQWSSAVREWQREKDFDKICIYCGEETNLTVEHLLPRSCGGEDIPDNVIMVCKPCNSKKGSKRLYEWLGAKNKNNHHRIAEGKYLKYLYSLHENQGTLDISAISDLCVICNMQNACEENNSIGKLSVYCIEGCFHK